VPCPKGTVEQRRAAKRASRSAANTPPQGAGKFIQTLYWPINVFVPSLEGSSLPPLLAEGPLAVMVPERVYLLPLGFRFFIVNWLNKRQSVCAG
jgi:hypothetical protein